MCVAFTMTSVANVLSQHKVTIQLGETTIRAALAEFQKQTNRIVAYYDDEVETERRVTVNYREIEEMEFLSQLLKGTGMAYTQKGDHIVIVRRPTNTQPTTYTLQGQVLGPDGLPLIGATVALKGQPAVTMMTDNAGRFSMTIWDAEGILVISYVGYQTREVTFKGSTPNMRILMEGGANSVDQVVVTGYQEINRMKNTTASTSVRMEDIHLPGITSVDRMLEGRIPDLILMSNSGEVGVVPRLRIRGTSTLIGNREPLWVIDGVVQQDPVPVSPEELNDPDYINRIGNAIAGINPQDIDRIDVLKDAAATAIYGAKAANGVIVITTKKGRVGKPEINYNVNATGKQRPRYTDRQIDLMNSQERIRFSRELVEIGYPIPTNATLVGYEGLLNDLHLGLITYEEFAAGVKWVEESNTDWFKMLTRDALSQQHTISMSGGSETTRYYASTGYMKDNDVIKGANNERYTATLNLNGNLSSKLSFMFGLKGNVGTRNYVQESIAPLDYAHRISRAIPAYGQDGEYHYYNRGSSRTSQMRHPYNILNEIENSSHQQRSGNLSLNSSLNMTITDWLNANAQVSYSYAGTELDQVWSDKTFYAANLRMSNYGDPVPKNSDVSSGGVGSLLPYGGELTVNNTTNNSYMARLQVNANKFFGSALQHNINGSVGYEVSSSKYNGLRGIYRGYYEDRGKQFANVVLADFAYYRQWLESNAYPTITDNLTNLLSYYTTVSYSYRDFFTLNANARVDGSNKFGDRSNERLLPIWSVSGNYVASEHFKRDWIDFALLKASYGFQGNMLDGQTPAMTIRKGAMDPVYEELVATLVGYPNPDLRWERTQSINVGADISLFNRGLQLELAAYHKKTEDAFMTKTISPINGIGEYIINSGTVQNKGFSIATTLIPVRTKKFQWTFATSFSKVFNEMQSLPGAEQYELNNFLNGSALVQGQPVGTFYSYRFLGLSPTDGGPLFYDWSERQEELHGKSRYDAFTMVLEASGNREPTMSGSLNNVFRYGNLRLNTTFAYSMGSKIRLFRLHANHTPSYDPSANVSREMLDRWQKPGDENWTDIPAIVSATKYSTHYSTRTNLIPTLASSSWEMYNFGNHRVVSGDFLKCSNISLTYMFPSALLEKMRATRLELSLAAANLFTISSPRLNGQAPTQSGFATVQLTDRPMYTFGINISL